MAEEEENLEAEIVYPITCGDSRANLIWRKFVCPGINVKCVQVGSVPGGRHSTTTVRPENGLPAPRVGPLGGARGRVCVLGGCGGSAASGLQDCHCYQSRGVGRGRESSRLTPGAAVTAELGSWLSLAGR